MASMARSELDAEDYDIDFADAVGAKPKSENAVIVGFGGFGGIKFDQEMQDVETPSEFKEDYELLEGQVITVGAECFRAPEALLQPLFLGLEQEGIHKLTLSHMKYDDSRFNAVIVVIKGEPIDQDARGGGGGGHQLRRDGAGGGVRRRRQAQV